MRLCMFTPADSDLERGWPGRIDGDVVVQLAAQTLQSFFASGSKAREHAAYPLAEVRLRAPVLEPPAIRIFDGDGAFAFANPTAVRSPGSEIPRPGGRLDAAQRLVAVIGADGAIAGWTGLVEWRAPELAAPKDRDFALLLGPTVETEPPGRTLRLGRRPARSRPTNTRACDPGDLLAGPVLRATGTRRSRAAVFVVAFDRPSASSPRSSPEASDAAGDILRPCPSTSASATSRASGTSSSATTARS